MVELKEGWCKGTYNLTNVTVDPENPRYRCDDGQIIIGKSTTKSENFDVLVFCARNVKEATIPNTIKVIDSYSFDNCNELHHLEIPDDSELQTVGGFAFSCTSIEKFTIPPKLSNLKNGWCGWALKLNHIDVSPKNPNFRCTNDHVLIGKSSNKSEIFDVLVFCPRKTESLVIPDTIKHIDPYAFHVCNKLKTVEIHQNSELQTVGYVAFAYSSIECFTIPIHLKSISDFAFLNCCHLKKIAQLPGNSQLQTIGKYSFTKTCIDKFTAPVHLTKIGEGAFLFCLYLKEFEIPAKSELKTIDKEAFSYSAIENFTIPPHLTKISDATFYNCNHLQNVKIPVNSELQIIEKDAFYYTMIRSLELPKSLAKLEDGWSNGIKILTKITVHKKNPFYFSPYEKILAGKASSKSKDFDSIVFATKDLMGLEIPSFIKHIGPNAFYDCRYLRNIDIPEDSILQTIGYCAFACSSIMKFTVPPHLTEIGERAFFECPNLQEFEIPANSKLKIMGECALMVSKISRISIPSDLEIISDNLFDHCNDLEIVDIPENSKLKIIGQLAFSNTSIRKFVVPRHLKEIGISAFGWCFGLERLEIPANSELQIIDACAFNTASIKCLVVPPHVTKIGNCAFDNCDLKIVEFDENSEIKCLNLNVFIRNDQLLIMISTKLNIHFTH